MSLDTLKESLAGFVRSVMSPVDYFALYGAKVIQQDSDLTLQLQPDDKRLPGMTKVPMRLGIPNATAKVQPGARGLVGFADGDPSKPFWGPWESAQLTELNIGGADNFVALANLVLDRLNSIKSSFDGHTHDIAFGLCTAGGTTGVVPSAPPGSPMPTPDSVAATLVKVK